MAGVIAPGLLSYVQARLQATVERAEPLAADTGGGASTAKVDGYGKPVHLWVRLKDGTEKQFVFHTASANEFGHDRRADRALQQVLAYDTFPLIPQHVAALDVGAVHADGSLSSLTATGEFFLITEWAEGAPYAQDLRALSLGATLEEAGLARAKALASYLARLHQRLPADEVKWARALRDTVGSGEGILGICDAYPEACPGVRSGLLLELAQLATATSWRLKARGARLSLIHGDFHPFNLVFREGVDFTALDASRGCAGEPADDLTALAINYVFFAIDHPGRWAGGFASLWHGFWDTYLRERGDPEVLGCVPLYFAWRALVVCCPRFYPNLSARGRAALLALAHRALLADRFDLEWADGLFS
jgi:hypothetical protein